uniref:NADH-ubiquinone oxidoreductase chain 4L n=1 Tax=Hirondellea gigas TaxID=1518452 RepID=A0A1B1RRZ4_9CRUS|nr:NADH dehydrogenase subunit 4L [Hirondellea gigas]
MMNLVNMLGLTMMIGGFLSFVLDYSHILTMLLSLELMSLSIFFLLSSSLAAVGCSLFYVLYFLVMVVCEGVLGLSLLVMSSFSYGGDWGKVFSNLLC